MKRKLNDRDVPEPVTAPPGGPNENLEPVGTAQPDTKPNSADDNSNFSSFALDARLLQAVTHQKFSKPTSVQAKAIPVALQGADVLARAKTGSGKTLAYLLPVLHSILRRKSTSTAPLSTSSLILVPTKELATQISTVVRDLTSSIKSPSITFENLNRKEDASVTRARLAANPDIVVASPSRAALWVNDGVLKLEEMQTLVVDEADLVLNYGYEDDVKSIASALPASGVQVIMMSATLRTEVDTLSALLLNRGKQDAEQDSRREPHIIDLSAEEADEQPTLSQYYVRCAEEEKFLIVYALFKLQLIKGKAIIFVADIDRCYRVKLFLEQFGIRSCVLNSELPVNSRLHTVEEFNKGNYNILIAADERDVIGNESERTKRRKIEANVDEEDVQAQADVNSQQEAGTTAFSNDSSKQPTKKPKQGDKEYGVSRGIDFQHVSHVLNFDLPTTSKSYAHRIGRTARAGQTGTALSFVIPKHQYRKHKSTTIPQCENDEIVLEKIIKRQGEKGASLEEWRFDMNKLEGFRYRFADALRSVTRIAVRETRTKELRQELINSTRLKQHFEENPDELRHLRHDTESHAIRQQAHLKHIPEYLLPAGGKEAVTKDVGFVGLRKDKANRIRKAREFNKRRGKGRIAKTKGLDPLKSLNVRGRAKK